MTTDGELLDIVATLRRLVAPFEGSLVDDKSGPLGFAFNTRAMGPNKKPLFFAGAQARKGYVSFYLFPVYMFPDLLERISPQLRARMQGKSCFNFKEVDAPLFDELAKLTESGFERFRTENLLG